MFNKISIGLFIVFFAATSTAAQHQFKLKTKAAIGSRIPTTDAESPIPFNKGYDELSAEQQAIFRASYGGLADTDIPPFPIKGTQVIYNPIIQGHKNIGQPGNLMLVAMVDETGSVENVSVYESPAPEITKLSVAVLFDTKFKPATCDGKPCKMEFPFQFKLRGESKALKIRNARVNRDRQ